MAKKYLAARASVNIEQSTGNFVIPIVTDSVGFCEFATGRVVDQAVVVYTGTNISREMVFKKVIDETDMPIPNVALFLDSIDYILDFIQGRKIGTNIGIVAAEAKPWGFELI